MASLVKIMAGRAPALGYCRVSVGPRPQKLSPAPRPSRRKIGGKIERIWAQNAGRMSAVIEYNMSTQFRLFRLPSDLFPLLDDPRVSDLWEKFSSEASMLRLRDKVGQYVSGGGRITVHPPPSVSLGSPTKAVRKKSMEVLIAQSRVLDSLGLPASPFAPINIHPSNGREGIRSLKRFYTSIDQMDSSLRRRLVFENEDKSFWTWQNIRESFPELPITLDAHHHLINNHGESLEEAFEETRESWGKVLPVVHIAAGKRGLLDRDHHDWVEEIPSAFVSGKNLLADVEVEAGRRDMVVLYLKAKYGLWQA